MESPGHEFEFRPRARRHHGGHGVLVVFTMLVLLGGGGTVAYFALNKENGLPPTHPEVVTRPAEKKEKESSVDDDSHRLPRAKEKERPKRDPGLPSRKENPPKDDSSAQPKKEMPKVPPMPAPGEDLSKPRQYKGHEGPVQSVALSSDSKLVLSIGDDKSLLTWAIDGGEPSRHHQFMSPGVGVACLPGRKEVVACDGGTLVVLDLTDNAIRAKMTNPRGGIVCMAVEPDGIHVVTGCSDGNLRRWNTNSQSIVKEYDVGKGQVMSVAVSRDGSLVAAGDSDGSVSVWNLGTTKLVKRWKPHNGHVTALAFDPDGMRLVSTGGTDKIAVISAADGSRVLSKLGVHGGVPLAVAWTSDGKRIITGATDRSVRLWDGANGKSPIWSMTTEGKVFGLAVDAQDRFVLAATGQSVIERFPLPAMKAEPPKD